MAKSKQRQSLHGAVLIMVLTVMVVLIIMLMATLTVVTTAGQRVYTKFEENQAYYTARSALDIFTESMLYDENYYANDGASTLKYSYTDKDPSTGTDKIFSKAVDLTQGQAIQGEIYKIKSQGVETKKLVDKIKKDTSHAVYDADLYNLVNTMTDDEAAAALGVLENMLATEEVFGGKIGADVRPENDFYSISVDGSGVPNLDSITYTVTLPKTGSGSNEYGLMVDVDETTGQQKAVIKVEVLDRMYDTGGLYDRAAAIKVVKEYNDNPADTTKKAAYDSLKAAIKSGKRSNDDVVLKITSTVTFMDTEATAVLVHKSKERTVVNGSRALTAFGGSASDNMNIVGGLSNRYTVNWSNTAKVYGNMFIEESFNINTGPEIWLTDGESIYVGKDFNILNANLKINGYALSGDAEKKPFIIVGGVMDTTSITTATFNNVDIILMNGVSVKSNYFSNTAGNVYCKGDFEINNSGSGSTVDGDLYIDGNFIKNSGSICSLTINGDLYVTGNIDAVQLQNLTVSGDVFVGGDVIMGNNGGNFGIADKNMKIDGITGTMTVKGQIVNAVTSTPFVSVGEFEDIDFVSNPPVFNTSLVVDALELSTVTDITDPEGEASIEITLPDGVKKTLQTHTTNFTQYYEIDSATGNYIQMTGPDPSNPGATINLVSPSGHPVYLPLSAEKKSGKEGGFEVSNFTLDGKTYVEPSEGSEPKEPETVDGNSNYGSLTLQSGTYALRSDYNYGTIYVKGGDVVDFVLDAVSGDHQFQFTVEVLDNDTTVNFYAADTDGVDTATDYQLHKCKVLTPESKNAVNNISPINVGDRSGCGIIVPKINYYLEKDVVLEFDAEAFLTGYIYAPEAKLTSSGSGGAIPIIYNGNSIGNVSVCIIGSALVESIDFPNNRGIAYINPELDGEVQYGKPDLAWEPVQYTRK